MVNGLIEFFFITLIVLAILHGLLASCTKILFSNKKYGKLTHHQLKVLQGDASVSQRIELMFQTFLVSFLTLNIHLMALGITFVYGIYTYANQLMP